MNVAKNLTINHLFSTLKIRSTQSGLVQLCEKHKETTTIVLPPKPRRPSPSFVQFINDNRTNVLQKHPDLKFGEVAKVFSKMWRELPPIEKLKYNNQFKQNLEAYHQASIDYKLKLTDEQKKQIRQMEIMEQRESRMRNVRKKSYLNAKPKRPLNAYLLFVRDETTKYGKDMRDVLKDGKWKRLSDAERQQYVKLAEGLKDNYDNEINMWEKRMLLEGKSELVRADTLRQHVLSK